MTNQNIVIIIAFALAAGCGGSSTDSTAQEEHSGGEHGGAEHATAEPSRVLDDGSRLFGAELSADREVVPLATITAAPQQYEGQIVKTEGEISQVCQAMGCWMELRADAESPGIRVPMAAHSFFLPRDLAGARATIEGTVHVEALTEEQREHLAAEGATATENALSIEATSVLVHP